MVKLIEQNDIDRNFDQTDISGKTLLHRVQHESLISYFIKKGCSLYQRDKNGRIPLFYSNTVAIYKELIAKGSPINITDYDDKTIFHFIKRHDIIEYILNTSSDEDIRRNINKVDKLNRTPIFSWTSLNVIKLFLEHHANVNHQAEKYSGSESETSQGEYIYDVVIDSTKKTRPSYIYSARFILSLDDNPSEVLSNEGGPFDEATNTIYTSHQTSGISSESNSSTKATNASSSSENSYDENVEDPDTKNYSVAMKLALIGKLTVEIVDILISYGADFSLKDCEGKTILHCILAPENKIRQVASIVQKVLGASKLKDLLNVQDSYGNSAIHLACSCKEINKLSPENKTAVIDILLKNGANIHLLNINNETPLHCLLKCNCLGKKDLAVDINRIRTKTIKFLPSSVLPHQKDEKGNALHHLVLAYSKYGRSFRVSTSSLVALVDRGVDINMCNDDGETPLHVAMKRQVMSHVIIEMLRNGADVNKKKGCPAYGNTSRGNNREMIEKVDEACLNDESRSSFQYMLLL
ncbi:ANKRD44 [Mytilus coruscus]|uniref:ANKRD44 n=1 Tax=Mytilus coruscus TaxID=42192 RepID=A0A6J8EGP7_MYTCO|nr:ANKRD44 [Mytilus coruscus]